MNSTIKKTLLYLALVLFVLLLAPQFAISSGAGIKTAKSSQQPTGTSTPMMPMPLVAPLFIANEEFTSTLVLVNSSGLSTYADVTLRDRNGTNLAQQHVTFAPYSQQQVDLGALLMSKGVGRAMGSVVVMPSADLKGPAILGALSITYLKSPEGDFIDQELAMPRTDDSQVLRGVADAGEGSPLVAVTSLADTQQHVTVQCLNSNGFALPKNITVPAGATVLIDACTGRTLEGENSGEVDSFWKEDNDLSRNAMGIALTSDGMPGSFAAFGLSSHRSKRGRYFSSVTFSDPMMTSSPNTIFTGVPVGQVSLLQSRSYTPEISVANFSAKRAHVTVQYALTSDGSATPRNVWTGNVPGQQTTKVTLDNLQGDPGLQDSFIVSSDASPGDVVAKLTAQTDAGMQEVEVLAKDEMVFENGGGHPWSLQDGTDSTILLFNHSNNALSIHVLLSTGGSILWNKTYALQSMETRQISIRDLIQNNVPDDSERTIPAGSASGIVDWFSFQRGVTKGRILQSDATTGMARNFSCGEYADVAGAVWSPSGTTDLIVGTTGDNGGEALAILDLVYSGSCGGSYATTTTAYDYYYTSSSPSTAAIAYPTDSFADVNAVGVGYATITGTITNPSTHCSASASGSVDDGTKTTISSISPGSFLIGSGGLLTITGSGLSGKGTPTVQFSVGGITTSNATVVNDSKVTANYTVSCGAQAQNISLTFPSFDNASTNSLPITTALPAAPAPGISFGGSNVTGTTQSVVVGQQIALVGTNPSLPACMSFVSGSWSALPTGSTGVGGYTNAAGTGIPDTTGGTVQPLPPNNATSYTFYWVYPGNSLQMFYSYEMSGGGGYVDSTPANVTFNVTGVSSPSMTALPTSGSLNVQTLTGCSGVPTGPWLEYGNYTGYAPPCPGPITGAPGITFTPSGPQPGGGSFQFVQLINSDSNSYTTTSGTTKTCSFSSGLDKTYFYAAVSGGSATDAPALQLLSTNSEQSRSFNATMYLLWQSNSANSIPVPVGYQTWQFSGSTTQSNGNWSTPSGSGGPTGGFVNLITTNPSRSCPAFS
jgi:hypothetical protein